MPDTGYTDKKRADGCNRSARPNEVADGSDNRPQIRDGLFLFRSLAVVAPAADAAEQEQHRGNTWVDLQRGDSAGGM
jgi:hypothetical protein